MLFVDLNGSTHDLSVANSDVQDNNVTFQFVDSSFLSYIFNDLDVDSISDNLIVSSVEVVR
jgi:hypothetical protein